MAGPRVVVVLGGGGAKAAAHAGAARALAEAGIEPVRWIGTSMGSVLAVALAAGRSPADLLARMSTLRADELVVRRRFAVLRGIWATELLDMQPLRRLFRELIPVERFDQLAVPCGVTAVDANSGEAVVFGEGGMDDMEVHDAVAASCALPPYYAPVTIAGRRYYDGGLRGPLPLWAAEEIDCDAVVAVDVGPGFDERGGSLQSPPPLIAASDTAMGWLMAGTTALLLDRWRSDATRPPLIHLRPVADRGATFAVDRIGGYAEAGYRAMTARIDELTKAGGAGGRSDT